MNTEPIESEGIPTDVPDDLGPFEFHSDTAELVEMVASLTERLDRQHAQILDLIAQLEALAPRIAVLELVVPTHRSHRQSRDVCGRWTR